MTATLLTGFASDMLLHSCSTVDFFRIVGLVGSWRWLARPEAPLLPGADLNRSPPAGAVQYGLSLVLERTDIRSARTPAVALCPSEPLISMQFIA